MRLALLLLLLVAIPARAQDAPSPRLVRAIARGQTPIASLVDTERGLVWVTFTEGDGPGLRRADHFCAGDVERARMRLRALVQHADRIGCRGSTCEVVVLGEYGVTQELHFRPAPRRSSA